MADKHVRVRLFFSTNIVEKEHGISYHHLIAATFDPEKSRNIPA